MLINYYIVVMWRVFNRCGVSVDSGLERDTQHLVMAWPRSAHALTANAQNVSRCRITKAFLVRLTQTSINPHLQFYGGEPLVREPSLRLCVLHVLRNMENTLDVLPKPSHTITQ